MKEYFCDQLNNTITCFHNGIFACCSGHKDDLIYYDGYSDKDKNMDWSYILKKKYYFFSLLNEKNIDNSPCKGCFYLREKTENDKISSVFNQINISNWLHCNCGCIYCARIKDGKKNKITIFPKKSPYYDIIPVIKNLNNQKLFVSKNLEVCIQGGDISVLKDFEKIIKTFSELNTIDVNSVFFIILSNSIVYKPIIRELIKKGKCKLVTSIDAGCKETYKKIKRVDKFNNVIKNLKRYCSCLIDPKIIIKYILVKNINDNEKEVSLFINKMKEICIKEVEFVLPDAVTMSNEIKKESIPNNWYNLYLYFTEQCNKNNIICHLSDRTKYVLNCLS